MERLPVNPERRIDEPLYTPAAAARYLGLAVGTVRWWTLGTAESPPPLLIADSIQHLLSFQNLVEIHVLSAVAWQFGARVPVSMVRRGVAELQEQLGCSHPLASEGLLSADLSSLVMQIALPTSAGQLVEAAVVEALKAYIGRVQRDQAGAPARLYPFTADRRSGSLHVVIDAAICSGVPCLADTVIPTGEVAKRFKEGDCIARLATAYRREAEEIEEAIRYEVTR